MTADRATMAEVARGLQSRIETVAEAMVAGYQDRIPGYAAVLSSNREEVLADARMTTFVFLQMLTEHRDLRSEEMALLRAGGRRRAEEGVPIDALLQAYSLGREVGWGYLSAAARTARVEEEEIYAAGLKMTRFIEGLTLAVTQEYLAFISDAYEEEHRRLTAMVDLVKAINRSLDLDDVVTVGLEQTRTALAVEWAAIWLVDLERGVLKLSQQQQGDPWTSRPGVMGDLLEIRLGNPGLGKAVIEGSELLLSGDALPEAARVAGCQHVALVPMLHRERAVGMLGIASATRSSLTAKEHGFLLAIADQLAVAVNQVQEHIREARTDFLTGLANRSEFERFLRHELSRADRFETPLTLALLDVDRLKAINDTHGHRTGDEALRMIGATLRLTVRSLDLAARIGGDEFAVVMPQTSVEGAAELVERLQEAIGQIRLRSGAEVSVSVGVSGWVRGQPTEELLAAADGQLYIDKRVIPGSDSGR